MISKILLYEIAKQTRLMLRNERNYNQSKHDRFLLAQTKAHNNVTRLLTQLEKQEFES